MPRHPRDPKLEQFWRRHLTQQRESGLTIRGYCREHGLNEPSFYSWRRIIGERDRPATPAAAAKPAFLPVAVVDALARRDEPPIDVRLANGHRVRIRPGCDRTLLAELLALLRSEPAREEPPC